MPKMRHPAQYAAPRTRAVEPARAIDRQGVPAENLALPDGIRVVALRAARAIPGLIAMVRYMDEWGWRRRFSRPRLQSYNQLLTQAGSSRDEGGR